MVSECCTTIDLDSGNGRLGPAAVVFCHNRAKVFLEEAYKETIGAFPIYLNEKFFPPAYTPYSTFSGSNDRDYLKQMVPTKTGNSLPI
jgi:hypothetical protein